MKIERIDHVHLYVNDLEKVAKFLSTIMDIKFVDPSGGGSSQVVKTAFDNKIGLELVQPVSPDHPIAKYMDEHGEGVATIGLKVPDIEEAIAELGANGIKVLSRAEVGNRKFALMDDKNAYGIQLELVEYDSVQGTTLSILGRMDNLPWM